MVCTQTTLHTLRLGGSQLSGRIRTHFLACEDIAAGSQLSGGINIFCPDALPCMRRCSWWVPAIRGKRFFAKYGGPSGGSVLSVGGIIIFRVIRRHLLAAAVYPAETLHVQYTSDGSRSLTTLTSPRSVTCMRPWAWCVPIVSLSCTVIFR